MSSPTVSPSHSHTTVCATASPLDLLPRPAPEGVPAAAPSDHR